MIRFKVSLLVGTCLLAACSRDSADHTTASQAMPLAVTEVRALTLTETITLPGTVTREQRARLASVYGGRVTAAPVAAGANVRRGDLLLAVGVGDARARVAAASANAAAGRAEAEQAAADETRYKALRSEGAVAVREYEQVHQRYLTAQARATAAGEALAAARSDLRHAEIRAPFDGLLAERPLKPGDDAAPGAIVALVVGGAPQVELEAGDAVYPHLASGAAVQVKVQGRRLQGTVIERVDAADPTTRTHRVKLRLTGDPPPPYGAYADVLVPTGSRAAVVVPAGAVIVRAGLTGVFVVDAQGEAQFRPVRAAAEDNGMAVIAAGLEPGERVVTAPPLSLGNGVKVETGPSVQ